MMYVYRNKNTEEVIQHGGPHMRLERLANWERLVGDDPDLEPAPAGEPSVLDFPGEDATEADWAVYVGVTYADEVTPEDAAAMSLEELQEFVHDHTSGSIEGTSVPVAPELPAGNASLAKWLAYAAAVHGFEDDPEDPATRTEVKAYVHEREGTTAESGEGSE